MDTPDVIVIGAGPAGASAAIHLAQHDVNVVMIDRAMPVSSKNLSGGVLWGNDLSEILPNWQKEAPLERKIVNKRIGLLAEEDGMVIDLYFNSWNDEPANGYSILRSYFDDWLAMKAQEAGVYVLPGITIDSLIIESGKVVGVRQGDDEMRAPLVIIAEGANPRLLKRHGFTYKQNSESYDRGDALIGIKETLHLDSETINQRFQIDDETGIAGEFILGMLPGTVEAGGFFYTNKNSLSIGVVIHLDSLQLEDRSYEIIEYFKHHPVIEKMIKDADLVEYGAKLIPELGVKKFPKLYGDGFMVIGDAAGFVFSNGIVIQGMNYAIKSGILAAEAAEYALKKEDYSERSLSIYKRKLDQSFIMKDFKRFKKVKGLTKNQRLFHSYPEIFTSGFKNMLTEDSSPKKNMIKHFRNAIGGSDVGILRLLRDGLQVRHI